MYKNNSNEVVKAYNERIDSIMGQELPSIEERKTVIEELNEQYRESTGNNLPSAMLSRLADWLLAETLRNKNGYKVSKDDTAVLSDRQLQRRKGRESAVESPSMDFLNQKYKKRMDSLSKKANGVFE